MDLNPPVHGAVGHSTWSGGRFSTMFCDTGYDFPGNAPSDGQYTCTYDNGWSLGDDRTELPDCEGT